MINQARLLIDNLEIDKAIPIIELLLENNITEAYGMMAYICEYQKNPNSKKFYSEYYRRLEIEAQNGNDQSALLLADALRWHYSNNIQRNDTKALELYITSAQNGNSQAQFTLYEIHNIGDLGLKRSLDRSLEYLKLAVKNNHPEALFEFGLFEIKNNNIKEGIEYIKKSSDLGYWRAHDYLSRFIASGAAIKSSIL